MSYTFPESIFPSPGYLMLRKPSESFDTEIMKEPRKFQYWAYYAICDNLK